MKSALFLVLAAISGAAFDDTSAQQISSQTPVELPPRTPAHPALNTLHTSAESPSYQETHPGNETSSVTYSAGALPAPAQSSSTDLGTPQTEVRTLPGMLVKPLSPPAPMTRLEPVRENGVTYLCGGVGLDEADHMKREANNYDLMLTFAARNGSYLADVNVDIADAHGRSLLKTTCGAPMMLVDLPTTGTYRIQAETDGNTVSRTVQLREERRVQAMTLVWPARTVDMHKPAS